MADRIYSRRDSELMVNVNTKVQVSRYFFFDQKTLYHVNVPKIPFVLYKGRTRKLPKWICMIDGVMLDSPKQEHLDIIKEFKLDKK